MTITADPITTEVVRNFVISCAEDMNASLWRSAHSSVIYEGQDSAVALMDEFGHMPGQSTGVPLFIGAIDDGPTMQSTDIYQEGLRLGPTRIISRGNGDPRSRPCQEVLTDVLQGYLTQGAAWAQYDVRITHNLSSGWQQSGLTKTRGTY